MINLLVDNYTFKRDDDIIYIYQSVVPYYPHINDAVARYKRVINQILFLFDMYQFKQDIILNFKQTQRALDFLVMFLDKVKAEWKGSNTTHAVKNFVNNKTRLLNYIDTRVNCNHDFPFTITLSPDIFSPFLCSQKENGLLLHSDDYDVLRVVVEEDLDNKLGVKELIGLVECFVGLVDYPLLAYNEHDQIQKLVSLLKEKKDK